jgi:dTDP-4-dehydrorhamnose reductase
VVNAAGYVRVDDAESDRVRCERENTLGPRVLAEACAMRGLPLVTFSSDLVFDGKKSSPYLESDAVCPVNVYGETKARAEQEVLAAHPAALVVRTSAFFGPSDEYNFVTIALRELETRGSFRAADDAVVSPTYVPDLVDATLDLLLDRARGIWHVSGPDAVSWAELARRAARAAAADERKIIPVSFESFSLPARRPPFTALASEHGLRLPVLDDALTRYLEARRGIGTALAANDGRRRVVCGGGDACPGHGRCGVHR